MFLNARKTVFGCVNNKGVEQPAHPDRLFSTFAIHFLESIIPKLATREFL